MHKCDHRFRRLITTRLFKKFAWPRTGRTRVTRDVLRSHMHRTASGIEQHAKNSRHDVPAHSRPVQAGLIDLQSQAPFHETPGAVCRHSLRVGPIPHIPMKKNVPGCVRQSIRSWCNFTTCPASYIFEQAGSTSNRLAPAFAMTTN